jgi:hypothetical protein
MDNQSLLDQDDVLIIHEITSRLDARLKEWYGDQAFWVSMNPKIRIYTSCFLLRYPIMTQAGEKFILVKIRRRSEMRSLSEAILDRELHVKMQDEFRSLQAIHNFFDDVQADLGAVRPLLYLERWSALVMEEYQSVSLRYLLTQCGILFPRKESMLKMQDAAQKTGHWLRLFHHEFQPCSYVEPEEQIMTAVQSYTRQLENISRGRINADSIKNIFADKMPLIKTIGLAVSQTHGDMSCDNILYSKDRRLCAIDVKGKFAPAYSDLGLILIHPETFKIQVLTFGLFYRERLLKAYRKAILEGYFGSAFEDKLLINLYCSLMLLDKWVRYEDNASRYRGLKWLLSRLLSPIPKLYFMTRINRYLRSNTYANCGDLLFVQ